MNEITRHANLLLQQLNESECAMNWIEKECPKINIAQCTTNLDNFREILENFTDFFGESNSQIPKIRPCNVLHINFHRPN